MQHIIVKDSELLFYFLQYSETWITRTAGDHQKNFESWVMLSLYFSHVASVAESILL